MKNFSGSSYIFYGSNGNWYDWERSKTICEQSGYNLVSIESREEWNFLNRTIQKEDTIVNASSKGHWPWAIDEPNGENENCAQMYRDYLDSFGRYNDVGCSEPLRHAGFICEFKGEGGNRPLIHFTRN